MQLQVRNFQLGIYSFVIIFISPDLFSAMFVDSKIAKNIVVGRSKLKYEINKGINPYLLEV